MDKEIQRQRRCLIPAWGIVLGIRFAGKPSAESASQSGAWFSIPNIPLVEIEPVPAQEFAIFLLKGVSAMMLLLHVNVLHDVLELTQTHRKCAIPALPEKAPIASIKRFDPLRGYLLCLLDELSLGKSSRQCCDNVNMISDAANAYEFGTEIPADCCKIGVHPWPHV
jgi:hypothetical protein